jgi:regulatory protein YycI of two-component signal transduction system YycFG
MAKSTNMITLLFTGSILIIVAIIFIIVSSITSNSFVLLILIWIIVFVFTVLIKSQIVADERDINNNDITNILQSTSIAVLLIIGSSLVSIHSVPIIGRAFENTVGYWWVDNDSLSEITQKMFTSNDNEKYNLNLIITQLFSDEKREQFDNYLKNIPFKHINYEFAENYDKENTELPINQLYEKVVQKYKISKASLISLATIITMYVCYMPMKYPWINK